MDRNRGMGVSEGPLRLDPGGFRYAAACETMLPHRNVKEVTCKTHKGQLCMLKLQAADIQKPFMSVSMMFETWHSVVFKEQRDGHIQSQGT